jgi:hypothetical protein
VAEFYLIGQNRVGRNIDPFRGLPLSNSRFSASFVSLYREL